MWCYIQFFLKENDEMKKLDTYINNYIQESLLDDDDDTIIARMDDILIEQITTQLISDGILQRYEFHQNKNIDHSCISYDKRAKDNGFKFDPEWQKAVDKVIAENQ